MLKFLQTIDAKIITSAGGIVLAAITIYALYDIAGSKIDGVVNAVNAFSASDAIQKDKLAEALIKNATAIEGNTKVMEQVLRAR